MPPEEMVDDEDRISGLPDELLHRVLYFLPPSDMVRTSVLSRRWRTVWKSMTALRITGPARPAGSAADFNTFVSSLLLFRDRATLLEFELCTYYHEGMMSREFKDTQEVNRYLDMWIRYSLMCRVQILKVIGMSLPRCKVLANGPLISKHLRILKFWSLSLECSDMDFSKCEQLEDLFMDDCRIYAQKISSQSLRSLCLSGCQFLDDTCTQICAPRLNSLQLDGNGGMTPFLASMPLLETASIRLRHTCDDLHGTEESVLLNGLSDATTLELIAEPGVTIFKQELNMCPTFNKLKTLVLNDEVLGSDGAALLIRFLQHVPVLEKLTLKIHQKYNHEREIEESCSVVKQPLQLEHLQVEVRCNGFGAMVRKFVRILEDNGITSISINFLKRDYSKKQF